MASVLSEREGLATKRYANEKFTNRMPAHKCRDGTGGDGNAPYGGAISVSDYVCREPQI
ncbi:hypothetical protein GCM10007972_02720 [Iodidimonas muriae]|uniref:Uncharacterized protein n=1 Tax=Iodidimonas muriae TaxID=261467 RepID=A0ABQ2L869_9PROT|nr:hypothetical protein JCM17843_08950 [Kordiimonadales bacterium JCM 17843]GGO05374.1 hypothetical protein GCM10007972_02720 [Iodidimonas muriae]